MGPFNNIAALVQIIAWCRPDNKPLPEPMMVNLLMHICITQPQWDYMELKVSHCIPPAASCIITFLCREVHLKCGLNCTWNSLVYSYWYSSVLCLQVVIIGSSNGSSPAWGQAINCTTVDLISNDCWGTHLWETLIKVLVVFIQENAFENAVYITLAIVFRP